MEWSLGQDKREDRQKERRGLKAREEKVKGEKKS